MSKQPLYGNFAAKKSHTNVAGVVRNLKMRYEFGPSTRSMLTFAVPVLVMPKRCAAA